MAREEEQKRFLGGPRPLGALVPRLTRPAYKRKSPAGAMIMADWPEIAGPAIAAVSQPLRLTQGTLTLACSGPVALELQHLAPQLASRINAALGRVAVERFRFVQQAPTGAAPVKRRPAAPESLPERVEIGPGRRRIPRIAGGAGKIGPRRLSETGLGGPESPRKAARPISTRPPPFDAAGERRESTMPDRRSLLAAATGLIAAGPALAQAPADPRLGERAMGRADAPLTVIEYFSLTCSHCGAFHRDTWPRVKAELVETGGSGWSGRTSRSTRWRCAPMPWPAPSPPRPTRPS